VPALAEGVLKVAVSGMLVAIEQMLARAGVHASELTLMPFGGAGPMLATMLAEAAGIRRIYVPSTPGTLCALGAASAGIRRDTMRTVLLPLDDETYTQITGILHDLTREAEAAVVDMVGSGTSTIMRTVDLRYVGQSSEITVPLGIEKSAAELVNTFHTVYERTFGHADRSARVQVVNLRATCARPAPPIRFASTPCADHVPRPVGTARLYSNSTWQSTNLYRRQDLSPGAAISGPAIFLQDDTTLLISSGWRASMDSFGGIVLERG
jgi:N-methylhydantoinase A